MSIGDCEIFGPVICIKRFKDFEDGLAIMNANEFANGSVIYTQSGYYAREFAKRTDGGMVGINVGIPVPASVFPFSARNSFFGDLHVMGRRWNRFLYRSKMRNHKVVRRKRQKGDQNQYLGTVVLTGFSKRRARHKTEMNASRLTKRLPTGGASLLGGALTGISAQSSLQTWNKSGAEGNLHA